MHISSSTNGMLEELCALSNRYGADPNFVLAGGGNSSCKDSQFLFIKPSGVSLADIREQDFIKLERAELRRVFSLSDTLNAEEREARVQKIMHSAVAFGYDGRASVEAPLHEVIGAKYIVHLHPALVNGMTCGADGASVCRKLFPDALWVEYVEPGLVLAKLVARRIADYRHEHGAEPRVIFLQNHGVFVGEETTAAISALYDNMMRVLRDYWASLGVPVQLSVGQLERDFALRTAPVLRSLLAEDNLPAVTVLPPFEVAEGPLTPDHIVYAGSFPMVTEEVSQESIAAFRGKHGRNPKVISVPGRAVFCIGKTLKAADRVAMLAQDAALIQQLATKAGGVNFMSRQQCEFIDSWEVESYHQAVANRGDDKRLSGKIVLVTGGAQGFGFGIAEVLAEHGATVIIADVNIAGARQAVKKLAAEYGGSCALALEVNIANEESVKRMVDDLTLRCGGLDIFVANAGVMRAGSVKTLSRRDWDFVTDINYTGYFLCVKHIAQLMSLQNQFGSAWSDIIQINSQSGLQGSNKNGAYAGSKFGTIGLTQSFALELISDRIKVNSICPGNFFDGALWSNPENGLFVQYLNNGEVPGAKTVEDVRKFYEKKIPMGRGCTPRDVAQAIIYAVEQQYETGQAIPVTGGQVMLH